jgi:hypothetical protein
LAAEPVDERTADVPLRVFSSAILVGLLGILLFVIQFSFREALAVASTAGLVAGSALAIGAVVGFLFGIPRTLQDEGGSQGATVYRANTNLEQISDWLSKILVGVGLTQIGRVPSELRSLTEFLSPALGDVSSSQAFALAVVIYYLITGFLLGYLWTRLYLAGFLYSADKSIRELRQQVNVVVAQAEEIRERAETEATFDVTALSMVDGILNPSRGVPPPSEESLQEAIQKASPSVRVQALIRAQETRSSSWRNDKPRMERTLPILKALTETTEAAREHMIHGQYGFALKDQTNPDWAAAERELTKAIELRGDWGEKGWLFYEFNRAACRIMLDVDFQQERPSAADVRQRIIGDLLAVVQDGYLVGLIEAGEAMIKKWMDLNGVTIAQLRTPGSE